MLFRKTFKDVTDTLLTQVSSIDAAYYACKDASVALGTIDIPTYTIFKNLVIGLDAEGHNVSNQMYSTMAYRKVLASIASIDASIAAPDPGPVQLGNLAQAENAAKEIQNSLVMSKVTLDDTSSDAVSTATLVLVCVTALFAVIGAMVAFFK